MLPAHGLFPQDGPPGFRYQDSFITEAEESELLERLAAIQFSTFEMRGVAARRRVAFFGQSYDRAEAPPIPAFLLVVRGRIAAWAGVEEDTFATALINKYPAGAPIGWHRDAPQYGLVSGISLLSGCRMRFRAYRSPAAPAAARRATSHDVRLEPRSAYLLTGESRTSYEHHIPPVTDLRYSITFRTLR